MRSLAVAALVCCGCAGKTTILEVRDVAAIAIDVESPGARRELLAARASSGALPGVADATRAADGAIDVRCASCFGDAASHSVVNGEGRFGYGGPASDVLTWQPDVLRVRMPSVGTAHLVFVVPKAALTAVAERRDGPDRDLGSIFFYLGLPIALIGGALIELGQSSSGGGRIALDATGIPLGVIGLAGVVTGIVYWFSPSGERRLYPPE